MEDFYINDHGASEFGAMLLSSWYVSGSTLTQNYLTSYTGSRITFCSTQYGLRSISLPVDIYGASPADAAAKRSALTAAFLGGTVELALPDGGTYTALLLDSGKAQEQDTDGCILSCTYTLAGYRHGALETLVLPADVQTFFAAGTAQQMECRITETVTEAGSHTVHYPNGGSCVLKDLQAGDTVCVDGITRQVLCNGQNLFQAVTGISGWPTVRAGENSLAHTGQSYVEYYPIFVYRRRCPCLPSWPQTVTTSRWIVMITASCTTGTAGRMRSNSACPVAIPRCAFSLSGCGW